MTPSRAIPVVLCGALLLAGLACARPGTPDGRVPAPMSAGWFDVQREPEQRPAGRARSEAIEAFRRAGGQDAPGTWVALGPTNIGGRVTDVAVDPVDPDRIWVGTAAGGVFRTDDGGATFAAVFDDQAVLAVGSLAVHPTDPDTVYVGTGEDKGAGFAYDGEGVFKTVDGGASWTHVGLAESRRVGAIAIDPTDGDRLFAAAGGDWYVPDEHRGVYRSLDGGATWERVLFVADDAGAIDVVIDPVDPDRVFAAIWQRRSLGTSWYVGGPRSGVYRSLDGGDTWVRLDGGLPTDDMGKIGLAIAPSDPDVVYAHVISPVGLLQGIYRSADGGTTWARQDRSSVAGYYGSFGYYFSRVRVDPTDADTVYSLDIRLLRSTNGGKTFGIVTNAAHVDWHDLIIEPGGRLIAGNDGGFWTSPDEGRSWVHAGTLPITQLYDLGIDAGDPGRRFVGSQDNGTLRTVGGAVDGWTEVLYDDGLQCEVDPSAPDRVYASTQNGGFQRSVDGGATFVPAVDGIGPAERTNWNAPLVLDRSMPTTMYTGTVRVYRSTDAMVSWAPISPDLTTATTDGGERAGRDHTTGRIRRTVSAIAVSPLDPDVLWAGTDTGRVWATQDGGGAWTEVTPPGNDAWVSDIEADPRDRTTAVMTLTGYRTGDRSPSVRRSDDLGSTWVDVTANLPAVPVNTVVVDPDWVGRWFVGTDVGVYVTDDAGSSWSALSDGMPRVVVLDLVRHDLSNTLFAGTHGRSMYGYDLAQLGPADGDGDGVDNNDDCALADPGAYAVPGEVADVRVDRIPGPSAEVRWTSAAPGAGDGTVHDVVRGDLHDLRDTGAHGSVVGVACTLSAASWVDAEPAPAGAYYLVRASNSCGTGGWGAGPDGSERGLDACP